MPDSTSADPVVFTPAQIIHDFGTEAGYLRAELDALRAQAEEYQRLYKTYKSTSEDQANDNAALRAKISRLQVERIQQRDIEIEQLDAEIGQQQQELDALRAELADVREQLGLADADVETAMGMNVSLRARLVQTEAVVEAARKTMLRFDLDTTHILKVATGECDNEPMAELRAALRAIPEAPPAKDHVNACPCWLCRPLHKPLPEAPPVAAGSGE